MFADVDKDELECLGQSWRRHLLAILHLPLWLMEDQRPFPIERAGTQLWGLLPLHSLGTTPGSQPRFVLAESGLSWFPMTFLWGLWKVWALYYLIIYKDRKASRGKRNESKATMLINGGFALKVHVPYILIQDAPLQGPGWKFNFISHRRKWETTHHLGKEHSFGGT